MFQQETPDQQHARYSFEKESEKRIVELLEELRELVKKQHHDTKKRWNRSLPFADYIVDRWKKAAELGFGEGSSIYDSSLVLGDVKVGRNTWIGPFTVLDGSGGLVIGDNCSISAGVQIYTHDTVKWATSGGIRQPEKGSVSIGHRCYVGPNVIISKGVCIGNEAVIGANSFVKCNVPERMKAWGTPALLQGTVDY